MADENSFLLHSFCLGIYITFVYDLLRIVRRAFPHRKWIVSLEDLGFWVYCGGKVFLLMYRESDGSLRWFAVMGALAGMLLYRKLLSGWIVRYGAEGLRRLAFPVVFVCRKVGGGMGKGASRLLYLLKRRGRSMKIRLTHHLKLLKMTVKGK
jgi:spore cortex biosynthesis protein YabQ